MHILLVFFPQDRKSDGQLKRDDMKVKKTIAYGLGSSAGVFVGMLGYNLVVRNDPGRGVATGLMAAFFVLVVWNVVGLCQRENSG
jgi:hypothetical protein